jgi:hypothetical protein
MIAWKCLRAKLPVFTMTAILTSLQENTQEAQNIGAASLMSTQSGGGNLVIWRHTYGFPDRLEAAFKLAEFLTRKVLCLEVGRRVNICLPASMHWMN